MINYIVKWILSIGAKKASAILAIPISFIIYLLSHWIKIDGGAYLGAIFGVVTTVVAGIFGKLIIDGYEKINTFDDSAFNSIKRREISKLSANFTSNKYNYITIGKDVVFLMVFSFLSLITIEKAINFRVYELDFNLTLLLNIFIKIIPAIFGLLLIFIYSESRTPIDNFLKYLNNHRLVEEKRIELVKKLNEKIREEQQKNKEKIKKLDLQELVEKLKEQDKP